MIFISIARYQSQYACCSTVSMGENARIRTTNFRGRTRVLRAVALVACQSEKLYSILGLADGPQEKPSRKAHGEQPVALTK